MNRDVGRTRCPHCGSETGIKRGAAADLPVTLTLAEFETLVRNEWRRRLGPEAYDRTHSFQVIRDLALVLAASGSQLTKGNVEEGVERVMADLRAAGKGRRALLQEIAKLRHAVRTVLRRTGADFVTAGAYLDRARSVLDESLETLSKQ